MVTACRTAGRALCNWMVCTVPTAAMANLMVLGPVWALDWRMALRSEPVPLSALVVTVKAAGTQRSSRTSRRGAIERLARGDVPRAGRLLDWTKRDRRLRIILRTSLTRRDRTMRRRSDRYRKMLLHVS